MTPVPDTSAPAVPPHLPAGFALTRTGLAVPEHSAAAPPARREPGALRAAWRKARTALAIAGACGALSTGGTVATIVVTHSDAAEEADAANRQALCPAALASRDVAI